MSVFDTAFATAARGPLSEIHGESVTHTPINGTATAYTAISVRDLADRDRRRRRRFVFSAANVAYGTWSPNDAVTDSDGIWLVDSDGVGRTIGGTIAVDCSIAQLHAHGG